MLTSKLFNISLLLSRGAMGSSKGTSNPRKLDGDVIAYYDAVFGAPFCSSFGSECSSSTLLNGRGNLYNGTELNMPNTIDGCSDGDGGSYLSDESLEKIVIRSGSIDGAGAGGLLEAGKQATIIASVFPFSDGSDNSADFFYADDAHNPVWTYIGTLKPSQGGLQDLAMEYTIPSGQFQAVRVNFRSFGNIGSCTNGIFDDRDDIVFAVSSSPSLTDWNPCFVNKKIDLTLYGVCTYDALYMAVTKKLLEFESSCPDSNPTYEVLSLLGADNETDARTMIDEMCKDAILFALTKSGPFVFDRFSGMDHDFNKAFFDGQSSWNDGGMTIKQTNRPPPAFEAGASDEWRGKSKAVVDIFDRHAVRREMTWPGGYENFQDCQLNAVMCCWVDHDVTQDFNYHNNTEICYVDNERAPSSNHINAGLSLYGGIHGKAEAFCHGFAWESGSLDDTFKGNHLFMAEIYENMHNKGMSNNVPGAPMCGCIEKMPVVSRADCSMLEYTGNFAFTHLPWSNTIAAQGAVKIGTTKCDASYHGFSNDLRSYYDKLLIEGKVSEIQSEYFNQIVVGEGFCGLAIYDFLGNIFNETSITSQPSVSFPVTTSPSVSDNSSEVPSLKPTGDPTKSPGNIPSFAPSLSHAMSTTSPSRLLSSTPSVSPSRIQSLSPSFFDPANSTVYDPSHSPSVPHLQ